MPNPKKILLVDDEPDLTETLQARLAGRGYEVVVANGGHAALEVVKQVVPDLIVLDLMMPVMDGTEVAVQLAGRDETKNIPIIFLTALKKTEEDFDGNTVGGQTIFAKPYNASQLIARIDTMLGRKGI